LKKRKKMGRRKNIKDKFLLDVEAKQIYIIGIRL
jgi:hypothetical protein